MRAPVRLRVEHRSEVAPVRRAAERMADALGLSELLRGRAAIVATELATNLVRHARQGQIILRASPIFEESLDVIAWDRGPGMTDVAGRLRDGVSSVGGTGTGLGAIGRLSGSFDLQSTPGAGTVIVARIGEAAAPLVDGLVLAMDGEEVSGDAWSQAREGRWLTVLLADGLGHGVDASRAAWAAVRELRPHLTPDALLERMHTALRPTRGAAVGIARLDTASGDVRFAGIGNIAATIVDATGSKSLVSMNGTLGHNVRTFRGFDHVLPAGALLVMHSDGCRGGWDLNRHPGLVRRDPLVVASLLVRDYERGRDDASVVVARGVPAPQ